MISIDSHPVYTFIRPSTSMVCFGDSRSLDAVAGMQPLVGCEVPIGVDESLALGANISHTIQLARLDNEWRRVGLGNIDDLHHISGLQQFIATNHVTDSLHICCTASSIA